MERSRERRAGEERGKGERREGKPPKGLKLKRGK
jgi:hypothetical protein